MSDITIKALRRYGGVIEWDMTGASLAHIKRFWAEIKQTGRAPDSGAQLESANWWKGDREIKSWTRLDY